MTFPIFAFIAVIILIVLINAVVQQFFSGINFNPDYSSQVDEGRSLDLKTKVSDFQIKPIFFQ